MEIGRFGCSFIQHGSRWCEQAAEKAKSRFVLGPHAESRNRYDTCIEFWLSKRYLNNSEGYGFVIRPKDLVCPACQIREVEVTEFCRQLGGVCR